MFLEDQVLLKGYVNINPNETAEEIRGRLRSLFKIEYDLIHERDFYYVKRDRNKISTPVTPPDFKWDFVNLKSLIGQGKLYVRIKCTYRSLIGIGDDDDDSMEENFEPVVKKKLNYNSRGSIFLTPFDSIIMRFLHLCQFEF